MTCEEEVEQLQPAPTDQIREFQIQECLMQRDFDSYVSARQSCSSDDDCTVIRTSCPFGCGEAVARVYASAVSAEHERLMNEYSKHAQCKYKCSPFRSASCVENRCTRRRLSP